MGDIILVEDDLDDIYFFKLACNKVIPKLNITTLHDGTELLQYIQENDCIGKVILLDLNMPKLGGLDVLRQLNQLGIVQELIIITYTTSDHSDDIKLAYQLGVKSYLSKPNNVEELTELVSSIAAYWLKFNLNLKGK